jgi:uncharacterized membrane protein
MRDFMRTTIAGGLLFLLPVVLVLYFLGYAVGLVSGVIQPFLSSRQLSLLGGVGLAILALLVLVLMSFIAGIIARTDMGGRFTVWLESTLLGSVPKYQVAKGIAQGFASIENTSGIKPSLISVDGGWRLGYLVGTLDNGWVTVFLPLSPKGTTGNVMYVAADLVRPLDITIGDAMGIVSGLGAGSGDALGNINLSAPKTP